MVSLPSEPAPAEATAKYVYRDSVAMLVLEHFLYLSLMFG